ncbi:repeat-containing protein [Candidatus Magnetomorum sp. HK-1]|nr:repeat-containing protein [Candidatus Magnetomorum sp. HK-1]
MPKSKSSYSNCPYKGLLPYTTQDADLFYGRSKWVQTIHEDFKHHPFIAFTGSSGSGKTSLINAGLIPLLHSEGNWQIASFRPKESPFFELSKALIPFLAGHLNPFDRGKEIKRLADGFRLKNVSLFDVSKEIIEKQSPDSRLLLVIDQFEELYSLCTLTEERSLFLEILLDAVDLSAESSEHYFNILISVRADFLGQILSDRRLSEYWNRTDHKLAPMSPDELREAIELPAQRNETVLEPGLSDYILKTCIPSNIPLPLISFSLKCLWEKEHPTSLSIRGFEEMGATELSLANYAESIYESLSKKEKTITRQIFLRLVSPGEGTEDVRCMINRNEMISRNWPLINLFLEKGLLIAERNHNDEIIQIEVVHDILLKEWGRLHGWIQENRDFRLWRKRLQSKMWHWEKHGQKAEDLLFEELLSNSLQWLQSDPDSIEFSEKRYIQNSAAKNNPGVLKKRLVVIARSIGLLGIIITLCFCGWHFWNAIKRMEILQHENIQLNQSLLTTKTKLNNVSNDLDKLDKKYQNDLKKWQNALKKADSADQKIKTAKDELQRAKDMKWRSEKQINFAEDKLKQSEKLLAEVQEKTKSLKEQTQEFERHYLEQVAEIKERTIDSEKKLKQAKTQVAAAEKLSKKAHAQLKLASEKQTKFETTIRNLKQKNILLIESACAFALTPLTTEQWQNKLDQSPLLKICKEKKIIQDDL